MPFIATLLSEGPNITGVDLDGQKDTSNIRIEIRDMHTNKPYGNVYRTVDDNKIVKSAIEKDDLVDLIKNVFDSQEKHAKEKYGICEETFDDST